GVERRRAQRVLDRKSGGGDRDQRESDRDRPAATASGEQPLRQPHASFLLIDSTFLCRIASIHFRSSKVPFTAATHRISPTPTSPARSGSIRKNLAVHPSWMSNSTGDAIRYTDAANSPASTSSPHKKGTSSAST